MPDATSLGEYYKTLTDQELLNLRRDRGFTAEAELVLSEELARRSLGPHDLKQYVAVTERDRLCEDAQEKGTRSRGPGILYFGCSYLNEADKNANIQVRTKWFALGGIQLIPIASYRFRCMARPEKRLRENDERRVIDRVPINWLQVFLTWSKTAILLVGAGLLIVGISWCAGHGTP